MRLTEQEIADFKRMTSEEVALADPKPVLDDLNIVHQEIGSGYRFATRDERTPSAFISLKNGEWKYRDFGSGNNGNIITAVMDATGKNFKTSLEYCLGTLGISNHLEVAMNLASQDKYHFGEKEKTGMRLAAADMMQERHRQNLARESSHQVSRIKNTYHVQSNQLAVDYLRSRGIEKIPPQMKIITGEYQNAKGETKTAFGIGILTESGKGADIHFLKQGGSLKSMSFGPKDISFFPNHSSKKVAIFESKMDYAAAYQQMPLDDINVIIANSTSSSHRVAEKLKELQPKSVMFFHQNDRAGCEFVAKASQLAGLDRFNALRYDLGPDAGQDPNDLHLDGVKLKDRVVDRDRQYFERATQAFQVVDVASLDTKHSVALEMMLANGIDYDGNYLVAAFKHRLDEAVDFAKRLGRNPEEVVAGMVARIVREQRGQAQSTEREMA